MYTNVKFVGKSELESMIKLKRNNIFPYTICHFSAGYVLEKEKQIALVCDLKNKFIMLDRIRR